MIMFLFGRLFYGMFFSDAGNHSLGSHRLVPVQEVPKIPQTSLQQT